ncbi:hypothetical protein EJB05_34962, partial [Eragrostis curvula]
MSVLWLVIPLGIAGAGEGVHFLGNMAFYYQEFSKALGNMAKAGHGAAARAARVHGPQAAEIHT